MTAYYHGGPAGLRIGDHILPSAETGAPSTASFGAAGICRRDRVYVTTDVNAAVPYASAHWPGRGRVYRIDPIGDLDPDPDCQIAGLSYQCPQARIIAIVPVRGKLFKLARRVLLSGGAA